jgi:integrase
VLANRWKTAAEKAGVNGPVGWHTFRRSIATWLIENDENVKVTQELLRHSHPGITLGLYAKAVTRTKRQAQEKVVNQLLAAQQPASSLEQLQ